MAGEEVCVGGILLPLGFFAVVIGLAAIRIIYEYERGVLFTLGKYSKIMNPGLNIIIPIIQTMRKVDTRIKTVDIPKQEVMTKDNVPVSINAVVYMRVIDPEKAVLKIQNYVYAVSQYGQTALRDVIGNKDLDAVLTERIAIAEEIKKLVDKEQAWFWTKRWQEGEREAEEDIRAGRIHRFDSAKKAIAFLHKRVKKGSGTNSEA